MKLALLLCAAAVPALAQQTFDFKSLDKLGENAKETTNITLEGDTLKLANSFLGNDNPSLQSIVKNLKGIYVRNFEYAQTGQYAAAGLAPVRAYVASLHWSKILDVKETSETTEIYIDAKPNNRLGGLALISAEPKEVTVIFISGDMDLNDVGKLSGNLGIPDMKLDHGGRKLPEKPDSKKE